MTGTSYLELQDLRMRFGEVDVLRGVDMSIDRGEFISLIGPSGSGKTTMLRIVTGTEYPTTGTLTMAGEDITHLPAHKRDFAMVFQHFALFPHKNVHDNVAYGLQLRKRPKAEIRERVDAMLDRVHMRQFAGRRVTELSGGQRQRVAIARALAIEPRLILLDEPTGALDAKLRLQMQAQLKELHRELGITFVHVTHNQSEALALADRVFVMHDGLIEQSGPPAEVFNHPRTRFVADFVGRNNLIDGVADGERFASPLGDVPLPERHRGLQGPCTAVVRTDALALASDAAGGGAVIEAELTALEYGGTTVTWFFTAADNELQLDVRSDRSAELRPQLGDRHRLRWDPDAAHFLGSD